PPDRARAPRPNQRQDRVDRRRLDFGRLRHRRLRQDLRLRDPPKRPRRLGPLRPRLPRPPPPPPRQKRLGLAPSRAIVGEGLAPPAMSSLFLRERAGVRGPLSAVCTPNPVPSSRCPSPRPPLPAYPRRLFLKIPLDISKCDLISTIHLRFPILVGS